MGGQSVERLNELSLEDYLGRQRATAPPHKSVGLARCPSPTKFLLSIHFSITLSELYGNV
jgi:hypothetical protein